MKSNLLMVDELQLILKSEVVNEDKVKCDEYDSVVSF